MAFWGGFLAVLLAVGLLVLALWYWLRKQFRKHSLPPAALSSLLSQADTLEQETPRSLSGADRLLLPRILKDFPDFDSDQAKSYVREVLQQKYGAAEGFTIHQVVISRYLPTALQKTVVFQAAVSWLEEGRRVQKRFDLSYAYHLAENGGSIAANCPNCGGALGYGEQVCPYCGSRVANALGSAWGFTEIRET